MIICDGKHSKPIEALPGLNIRGATDLNGEKANINFNIQIEGKHYCEKCFLDKIKDFSVHKIAKEALQSRK